MKNRCVVIGSGLGGLATAAVLAREGYEVTVVEQSHRVGACGATTTPWRTLARSLRAT